MLSDGSRSRPSAVGEAGTLLCQYHLIMHGFNVAVPVVPDGTDLIAYDQGRAWQLQVKTAEDSRRHQAFDLRGSRKANAYQYVDAFLFCCLASQRVWCLPAQLLEGARRIRLKGLPELPAEILRHQPTKRFPEAVHPCRTPGRRWTPDVEMLPASTRECVAALVRRGGSHPQAESLKQKGRPRGSVLRQDRRGRSQSGSTRRRRPR